MTVVTVTVVTMTVVTMTVVKMTVSTDILSVLRNIVHLQYLSVNKFCCAIHIIPEFIVYGLILLRKLKLNRSICDFECRFNFYNCNNNFCIYSMFKVYRELCHFVGLII